MAAYDGRIYLADTSAWTNAHKDPAVYAEFSEAVLNDQITTCPLVVLELVRGALDLAQIEALGLRFSALTWNKSTDATCRAALHAIGQLAEMAPGPGYHRVAVMDAMIAATAQDSAVFGVLHYDRHYERIAQVIDIEQRWIAPPGSL